MYSIGGTSLVGIARQSKSVSRHSVRSVRLASGNDTVLRLALLREAALTSVTRPEVGAAGHAGRALCWANTALIEAANVQTSSRSGGRCECRDGAGSASRSHAS